jgi:hypothetical protein
MDTEAEILRPAPECGTQNPRFARNDIYDSAAEGEG